MNARRNGAHESVYSAAPLADQPVTGVDDRADAVRGATRTEAGRSRRGARGRAGRGRILRAAPRPSTGGPDAPRRPARAHHRPRRAPAPGRCARTGAARTARRCGGSRRRCGSDGRRSPGQDSRGRRRAPPGVDPSPINPLLRRQGGPVPAGDGDPRRAAGGPRPLRGDRHGRRTARGDREGLRRHLGEPAQRAPDEGPPAPRPRGPRALRRPGRLPLDGGRRTRLGAPRGPLPPSRPGCA